MIPISFKELGEKMHEMNQKNAEIHDERDGKLQERIYRKHISRAENTTFLDARLHRNTQMAAWRIYLFVINTCKELTVLWKGF
jgi:hypothetical protein